MTRRGSDAETGYFRVRLRKNLLIDSQVAQDRKIDRIDKIAAELVARKRFFIEQRDFVASACQSDGGDRSSRARADDSDIDIGHSQSLSEISPSTRNGNAHSILYMPTSARRNSSRHSAIVNARCTESGPSVRVMTLAVNVFVSMRMP